MGTLMTWDDVQDAIDHHREGHLQLRAVAWSLRRFRRQAGQDVTPADLMDLAGASQSAAYRAIQEINRHSRIQGNSRFPVPGKRENPSRKPGIPPDPPIEERELESVCVLPAGAPACEGHDPSDASTEEEIRAACDRLLRAGVASQWYDVATDLMRHWNARWVEELVHEQRAKHPRGKNAQFCRSILNDWRAEGGPPSLRPKAPLRATGTAGRSNPADFLPENW